MTNPTGRQWLEGFTEENPLPLSFSQWYNNLDTCIFKWHLSYNMKYRKLLPKSDIMEYGTDFHGGSEEGFDAIKVVDDKVVMFTEEFMEDKTERAEKELRWLEQWMQNKYDEDGELPEFVGAEVPLEAPPEQIHGIWVQRIGIADLVWKDTIINEDDEEIERYYIWDIKTGDALVKDPEAKSFGELKSGVNRTLHQLYYYRSIMTLNGRYVYMVGGVYPKDEVVVRRIDRKVGRDEEYASRMSTRSINSQEQKMQDALYKALTQPIEPEYNSFYCHEWCEYAEDKTGICNFEPIDITKLRIVESFVELKDLVDELQDEQDKFLYESDIDLGW